MEKVTIEIIPESIQLIKMTDEEYFSSKYEDYISNSRLGLINPDNDGSTEKYLSGIKSKYSESFELGSAVHAKVLQPDFYEISDIRKPGGKLGLFAEEVLKCRKNSLSIADSIEEASKKADYYNGSLTSKRLRTAIQKSLSFYLKRNKILDKEGIETLYLSDSMNYKYEQCMQGLLSNSKVLDTLYPKGLLQKAEFYNEYAILANIKVIIDDSVTVLKVKAKLDNFTVDHETQVATLNDLKTTGKPVSFFMGNQIEVKDEEGRVVEKKWIDGSFQHYNYYRQMGMYLWLMSCYLKSIGINYTLKANMVVVETVPNFQTKIYPVSKKYINQGLDEFKKLITLVAKWAKEQSIE